MKRVYFVFMALMALTTSAFEQGIEAPVLPVEKPSIPVDSDFTRVTVMLEAMSASDLDRFRVDCSIIGATPDAFPEQYVRECKVGLQILDLQSKPPTP